MGESVRATEISFEAGSHMLFQCKRNEAGEVRSGLALISVSESDIQTDHPGVVDYSAYYQPMGNHKCIEADVGPMRQFKALCLNT